MSNPLLSLSSIIKGFNNSGKSNAQSKCEKGSSLFFKCCILAKTLRHPSVCKNPTLCFFVGLVFPSRVVPLVSIMTFNSVESMSNFRIRISFAIFSFFCPLALKYNFCFSEICFNKSIFFSISL
ncbi:hypothetical protein D3C87_1826040 [compost metagenome]